MSDSPAPTYTHAELRAHLLEEVEEEVECPDSRWQETYAPQKLAMLKSAFEALDDLKTRDELAELRAFKAAVTELVQRAAKGMK